MHPYEVEDRVRITLRECDYFTDLNAEACKKCLLEDLCRDEYDSFIDFKKR